MWIPDVKGLKNGIDSQKKPPKMFCKKGVLKNIAKFTGNHLC